jgi:hypothetical protein
MECTLYKQIQSYISTILRTSQKNENLFDKFMELLTKYYEKPANNMLELRNKRNKKQKGDIFECFCLLYMKYVYKYCDNAKYQNVWLLKNLPDEIKERLNLTNHDVGIDLIAQDSNDKFYAIQAKYRKKNRYKMYAGLSWKVLSTFYGLVLKTGPYKKHIVITNGHYARHIGIKTKKDESICLKTLQKIKYIKWLEMTESKAELISSIKWKYDNEGYIKIEFAEPGDIPEIPFWEIVEPGNICETHHCDESVRKKRLEHLKKIGILRDANPSDFCKEK